MPEEEAKQKEENDWKCVSNVASSGEIGSK